MTILHGCMYNVFSYYSCKIIYVTIAVKLIYQEYVHCTIHFLNNILNKRCNQGKEDE